MVMIHGSYATTSTWKQMLPMLTGDYRCILIKLPGHCGTPDPSDFDAANIETERAIIEAIIEQECDEPVHLVGHSYGGVVALALALSGRLQLSQLTLFEPVATWVLDVQEDLPSMKLVTDFLKHYRRSVELDLPNACGLVIDFWSGGNHFEQFPNSVKLMMSNLQRNNVRHWDICTNAEFTQSDLMALEVCTTIIYGNQSNVVAKNIAEHLYQLLSKSNLIEIDGASHGLVNSHAKECVDAMMLNTAT
ncbi:alpha/beta fold hydrolase [Vibrio cionasavignyae]|uniref:alpha/beta fold hydrolase n=1 Tax=Vibrio cionasavignyae TaxID=2910252 RepID=UPI003D132806